MTQFNAGYNRASSVSEQRPADVQPADWFSHPQNRPSPGDSDDFRGGYWKRVSEIAELEGWTMPRMED